MTDKKSKDRIEGRRLLDRSEVRAKAKISDSTLQRRIDAGVFPAPIELGPRCQRWWEDEVDAAIDVMPRRPSKSVQPRANAAQIAADEKHTVTT